jgi:predicted nucleic acid-binding protein
MFWEDHLSLGASASLPRAAIRGHNQVTDAYLLTLCLERRGRLATLDQGILSLAATAEQRSAIYILPE